MRRKPRVKNFITFKEIEAWKSSPEGRSFQEGIAEHLRRAAKMHEIIRKCASEDSLMPDIEIDSLEDHIEKWQKGVDSSLLEWQKEIEDWMKDWQSHMKRRLSALEAQVASLKRPGDD